MKTEKYNVTGMTCAACQANVTRCVSKLEGVADVNVSLLANQMTVSYDETKIGEDDIVQAVEKSATAPPLWSGKQPLQARAVSAASGRPGRTRP